MDSTENHILWNNVEPEAQEPNETLLNDPRIAFDPPGKFWDEEKIQCILWSLEIWHHSGHGD